MPDSTLVVTARTVDDLLGLVPHLLGFHPTESLVVVLVEAGRVVLTARLDLPDARAPGMLEDVLARMAARFPSSQAWYAAYGADAGLAWQVLRRCQLAPPEAIGAVYVDGASWWPSPDGPPRRYAPRGSGVAVQAEGAGMAARSSRAELAASVAGPPPERIAELDRILEQEQASLDRSPTTEWPALMRRALTVARVPDAVTPQRCARLALLAQHPPSRDVALLAVTSANARRHVDLWRHVVRRCPDRLAPHPLGLLGVAAWVSGDGALQSICLERARALDPGLPLAGILASIIDALLPPTAWPRIRRDIARHMRECPQPSDDPTTTDRSLVSRSAS